MEFQLNPSGCRQVIQEYDIVRGYGPQLAAARGEFGRTGSLVDTELNRSGVVKKSVFDSGECDEANARFVDGICEKFDRSLAVRLLDRIFSTDIDSDIISYFGSEYFPIAAGFTEAQPGDSPTESDRWHCDAGPSNHLIMAVYFTDSEADGANTLFIDRKSTSDLKSAGYVYCDIHDRVSNIEDLTDELGMERPEISTLPVKAGDVIVFDAPNILHRRSMPKLAARHVMFVAITPSILSWREVVGHGTFPLPLEAQDPFLHLPGYAQE